MKVRKFSSSVKKFAAIAGAASLFLTLPVLAENKPVPEAQQMNRSASESSTSTTSGNLLTVAESSKSFHVLTGLLRLTDLDEAIKGGSYTVFAPTDAAFAALPPETFQALLKPENRQVLMEILKYHVLSGAVSSNNLKSGAVKTVEGANVEVNVASGGVTVGGATVTQADIQASNGVIHVIDRVIVPPAIAKTITSKFGANALTLRSLSDATISSSSSTTTSSSSTSMSTSSSSTMTDSGSSSMTGGSRNTQMNSGSSTMTGGSRTTAIGSESNSMSAGSRNTAMNSGSGSTTTNSSSASASLNLVAVAASSNSFKTLTAALKATGLDKELATGGPYTIFAPTDDAFNLLGAATIQELLKPQNRQILTQLLKYHVIQGEKTASTLSSGQIVTILGAPAQVNVTGSGVTINGAKVVQADLKASNGVIHAIDKVILPARPQR